MAWLASNAQWIFAAVLALLGAGGAVYVAGKKGAEAKQARAEEQRAQERTQKVASDARERKAMEIEEARLGGDAERLGNSRWVRDED